MAFFHFSNIPLSPPCFLLWLSVFREEFRVIPRSQSIISGESLVLNCTPPRGYPEPKIVWKKDGQLIAVMDPRMKVLPDNSLQINDAQSGDQGRYSCVAENTVAIRESPQALIKVSGNQLIHANWRFMKAARTALNGFPSPPVKPRFIVKPEDVFAAPGETVSFACKVDGDPPPYITWTRNDSRLALER